MNRYVVVAALLCVGCGQAGTTHPSSGASSLGSSGASRTGSASGSGASTSAASGSTTGSTGSSSTTTAGSLTSTASSASSGSGGACIPDNGFQGSGVCCSGHVDASGYCVAGAVSNSTTGTGTTGSSGTTSTSTSSTTATGTTTGGTCPTNLPNLSSGQTQSSGPCNTNPSSPACPKGFACEAGQCVLNRSNALQITLSFDDSEDFDLHVLEPMPDGGECEIFYGAPGPVPAYDGGFPFPFDAGFGGFGFDAGFPIPQAAICSKGWLDRDSNAACNLDNVNIENVLYPSNQAPPRGHYKVRVDYWQDCDGKASSNYAVQVLRGGVVTTTCASQTSSQANGGGRGSGVLTTEFDIP
jgi:hypothetical protein